MRPLGVGIVFVPSLLPLLTRNENYINVLELEPQTLWQLSRADCTTTYRLNQARFSEIAGLSCSKLVHSVGLPFAGAQPIDAEQVNLLRQMIEVLKPPWVSDHLSFNAFFHEGQWSNTAFFLPARQSPQSIRTAARKIQALAQAVDRPVAFETAVNYLKPHCGELPDGVFFADVAQAADCGILLDLHNLWVNQCNGRDYVEDVLASIPLERVWEIHVAGGSQLHGHQLDAHSGGVPEEVWEYAHTWVPLMKNLGAIVFEILDEYVHTLGDEGINMQIELMQKLWTKRPPVEVNVGIPKSTSQVVNEKAGDQEHDEWQQTLGSLVVGRDIDTKVALELKQDPGLALLQQLVFDIRSGFISQGLRYTMTLLLLSLGPKIVRTLLVDFTLSRPPEMFVSAEADAFAQFIDRQSLNVPFLEEVLAFEWALVRASLYQESRSIKFIHDPVAIFDSLDKGGLPRNPNRVDNTVIVRFAM